MGDFTDQAIATLLVSLRIAPTFAFAQPFTLLRVPASIRLMLSISLAGWLVAGNPAATWQSGFWSAGLPFVAANELFLGITLALALQLAFAALLVAGRTIDIQAGFGLAADLRRRHRPRRRPGAGGRADRHDLLVDAPAADPARRHDHGGGDPAGADSAARVKRALLGAHSDCADLKCFAHQPRCPRVVSARPISSS